ARNFPFRKQQSDLDIELDDHTADEDYLAAWQTGVTCALDLADADLAIYLAGADPYIGDRLGRLSVSKAGLMARDQFVMQTCQVRGIPVAVVMAGGYAKSIADIVDIHYKTIEIAAESGLTYLV
ncbi:MAG: histone deacetylase, partial [Anaerolineae bacterium]|nr:histone deacetylase [Anaerolineae bacterium]